MRSRARRLNCTRSVAMPLRLRSRASSSSRKASLSRPMARSSSSSASWPVAMTPPSRTSAAGSSASAPISSAVIAAGGASASVSIDNNSEPSPGTAARTRGRASSVARRPLSSRGRAWRKAMRAVMRSTSARWRSEARSSSSPVACKAAIASCRCVATRRSRKGCVSQWRKARLPMPVQQPSSVDSSVGASWPRKVRVSSRLRCVVGGRSIRSPARCTDKTMDMGERATLRVLRVAEQRCRGRVRQAQVLGAEAGERGDAAVAPGAFVRRGRCRTATRVGRVRVGASASHAPSGKSAATRISAGARRAIQPASSPSLHSVRPISPFESAVQASPNSCAVARRRAAAHRSCRRADRSPSTCPA